MNLGRDYRDTDLWRDCVRKREHNIAPWKFFGIPSQFYNTTPDDFKNGPETTAKRFRNAIRKSPMVWSHGHNLLFYGKPGTGKSLIAAELVKEVVRYHDHRAYFISFERLIALLETIKTQRQMADQQDKDLYDDLRLLELVAIDGFGEVDVPNFLRPALGAFIRARTDREDISTILTTNLSSSELLEVIGEKIAERIADQFSNLPVEGKSYTKKNRVNKIKEFDDDN